MPQVGPLEILAIAVIALLLFGPEKLPEIARTVGQTVSQLRRMADEMRDEFQAGMNLDEETPSPSPRATAENSDHPLAGGPDAQEEVAEPAASEGAADHEDRDPAPEPPPSGTPPSAAGMRWELADDHEAGTPPEAAPADGDRAAPAGDPAPSAGKSQPA
jgi:Tat protein translocase TatB subunit